MKYIFLIITILISFKVFTAEDEKVYTKAEFEAELKERVSKQVDRLKKTSLTQLTKDLLEKERMLEKREENLKNKEEILKLSEKSLTSQAEAFNSEKKKILGCITDNEKKEVIRINQLVKVISGMKPVKAAELLSVQEGNISVKILEKIDPVKASKIFNSMDKEVSARLQKQYLNMKQ